MRKSKDRQILETLVSKYGAKHVLNELSSGFMRHASYAAKQRNIEQGNDREYLQSHSALDYKRHLDQEDKFWQYANDARERDRFKFRDKFLNDKTNIYRLPRLILDDDRHSRKRVFSVNFGSGEKQCEYIFPKRVTARALGLSKIIGSEYATWHACSLIIPVESWHSVTHNPIIVIASEKGSKVKAFRLPYTGQIKTYNGEGGDVLGFGDYSELWFRTGSLTKDDEADITDNEIAKLDMFVNLYDKLLKIVKENPSGTPEDIAERPHMFKPDEIINIKAPKPGLGHYK